MPARRQPLADARVVQDLGDRPAVRPAARPAAGAAVVGRLVRVVHAGRAVAERRAPAGRSPRQPDVAQHPLGDVGHLVEREADVPPVRARASARVRSSCSRVARRRGRSPAQSRADLGGQPREQRAGDQRDRSQHADRRRQQRAQRERPAADVDLVRRRAQTRRDLRPPLVHPPRLARPTSSTTQCCGR